MALIDIANKSLECSTLDEFLDSYQWSGVKEKQLTELYNVCHMSIKDIRMTTGLSQKKFGDIFTIPMRTIQSWELGDRESPVYVKLLIASALGLYKFEIPKG